MKVPFLTAKWKNLIIANYEVNSELLAPYLPEGLELDQFNGKNYISLVGFKFEKLKLFGFIPYFPKYNFEEVNLRFYVKKKVETGTRRGVSFIKEIVPSRFISYVARTLYNEPYEFRNTSYLQQKGSNGNELHSYSVWEDGKKLKIEASTAAELKSLSSGSLAEFIMEHYWGYTQMPDGRTSEYEVEHQAWKYREVHAPNFFSDLKELYPQQFTEALSSSPSSVFVGEGSQVKVSFSNRSQRTVNLNERPEQQPLGWVLYDGACGFCSWWIPYWRPHIRKAGYDTAPVQAKWVNEKLKMNVNDLSNDIRLLLRNGTLINGADAYIYGMSVVWWARPFGIILGLPLFRQLTWIFYKIFNKNRFLVSKACRLPPEIK